MMEIFQPFGVGAKCRSIMDGPAVEHESMKNPVEAANLSGCFADAPCPKVRGGRDPASMSGSDPSYAAGIRQMLFPTTIAGSLPKPEWLAEPNVLWAPWKSSGEVLARAKRDATLLAVKLQEDAGVDIVTEGEQARQHFVHGFLEKVDGIDFAHKVEMGIRKDRYKAMVPQVVAPLKLKGRVHADEARTARAHTGRQLKFTLPGPMTIIDTIADKYYGDRVKMAFAFAELLNEEARALQVD